MKWLDCAVFFSSLWLCVTSSPLTLTRTPDTEEEAECPSNCVLQFDNVIPTAEGGLSMPSRKLNPQYYEASRAGRAIQLYLNTLYGSPFRLYLINQVHNATAEDMGETGMKYILEFSVKDLVSESPEGRCSGEVIYPKGKPHSQPQIQGSWDGLPQLSTSDKEQAFYQKYNTAGSTMSAENIPDSYGNIEPEMKPFWHLGWVASSFVMLNESSENTLYSMAQVAKITQLKSEDDQLRFEYEVLLHDMVSQGIFHWKLLISWSPTGGVKVLQTEQLPRCQCKSKTSSD